MFCYNCGQKVMEGAKFCSNCGSSLSAIVGGQPGGCESINKDKQTGEQKIIGEDIIEPQPSVTIENTENKIETVFKKAFGSANK